MSRLVQIPGPGAGLMGFGPRRVPQPRPTIVNAEAPQRPPPPRPSATAAQLSPLPERRVVVNLAPEPLLVEDLEEKGLTLRQKLLAAATKLCGVGESFRVEELIVRAFELYPGTFSLRGHHAKYPDSNRVLAKLSGDDGLCKLGWLEHVTSRCYTVTSKGHRVARSLGL